MIKRKHDSISSSSYKLSICIATRNRCELLLETINSVLVQLGDCIEIVVVDGASTDATPHVMSRLASENSCVSYYREEKNGGIDRDYDKAVIYAKGMYCWLMSDDDWILPGAVNRVLKAMDGDPSLIVVDAQVRDIRQSEVLLERRLELNSDQFFGPGELEQLFLATVRQLSFIGSTIVRRSLWIERHREQYYESYFVHVAVIFQQLLPRGARVLVDPCISIRYGNASWVARGFEIWSIRWPQLIWSLPTISLNSKLSVVSEKPYESIRDLILWRSKGAYSLTEYRRWIATSSSPMFRKILGAVIAMIPGCMVNLVVITYVLLFSKNRQFALVDLIDSPYFVFKFFIR
ncbi:Glycosyl transferase family 2 [anaerobic digester metagenome]